MSERILLNPKATFLASKALAASHSELMGSPPFQAAAAQALLAYQYRLGGGDPQVLAIAMSKLRGAQEYLTELMNLGLPEAPRPSVESNALTPPEEALRRPFMPPTQ